VLAGIGDADQLARRIREFERSVEEGTRGRSTAVHRRSARHRARILECLWEQESASADELAQQFTVSRVTIHRDLDQPAAAHCVRKTHGGATILSSVVFEGTFNYRARRHQEEKRALAAHIASLIEPGMTVISDDSTTTAALGEFLHAREPLAIAANAESLVSSLIRHEEISVICIGGHYNVVTGVFLGVDCEMALERLRADLGVFSAAASRGGAAYLLECELTRAKIAMKAAAELSFLSCDLTKFGKLALHLFGRRKEFDCIVTTAGVDQAEIDRLRASEVPINAAFEDSVGRMLQ